jgi:hypothetical protein
LFFVCFFCFFFFKKQIDEQPTISRAEIAANVKGTGEFDAQIRAREEEALRRKERLIAERKEHERAEKEKEERIYLASLKNAGVDEKKRMEAIENHDRMVRAREEKLREWEAQRRAEEEEGAKALVKGLLMRCFLRFEFFFVL